MTDNNRVREPVPFEIEAVFTHKEKAHGCVCENISMGGVLLESTTSFNVGDIGHVLITLKSGATRLEMKGDCRVARVLPSQPNCFQLGLESESLDSESSIVLFNMIRYQKV